MSSSPDNFAINVSDMVQSSLVHEWRKECWKKMGYDDDDVEEDYVMILEAVRVD